MLALLETPLAGLLHAAATGTLAAHPPLRWRPGAAVTVVVASAGYPAAARSGDIITGADRAGHHPRRHRAPGRWTAPSSRPADGCCAVRPSGRTSPPRAPRRTPWCEAITMDGAQYRRDIAEAAAEGRF